jgi:hypothetical protein
VPAPARKYLDWHKTTGFDPLHLAEVFGISEPCSYAARIGIVVACPN